MSFVGKRSGLDIGSPEKRDELIADSFAELRFQRETLRHKKHLATSLRLTLSDIEVALRLHHGNLLQAAKFLGVERALLRRKVNTNPALQRLLEEIREEVLDLAEAKLVEQVEEGYFPAVSLYLRTQGKERGYTEKFTGEMEWGENATRTAAALIEAMRRGAQPQLPEPVPAVDVEEYEIVEATAE